MYMYIRMFCMGHSLGVNGLRPRFSMWVLLAGTLTFWSCLYNFSELRARLGCRLKFAFYDSACIDQSNEAGPFGPMRFGRPILTCMGHLEGVRETHYMSCKESAPCALWEPHNFDRSSHSANLRCCRDSFLPSVCTYSKLVQGFVHDAFLVVGVCAQVLSYEQGSKPSCAAGVVIRPHKAFFEAFIAKALWVVIVCLLSFLWLSVVI